MERNYESEHLSIATFSFLTHEDLAALQDELNNRVWDVRSQRLNVEPPAAELGTVIVVLITIFGTEIARSFFGEMGRDAYQAVRNRLLEVLNKANQYPMYPSIPMCIELGRLRFHFTESLTETDLLLRIRKADKYMRGLPEGHINDPSRPERIDLIWENDQNEWRKVSLGRLDSPRID